MPTIINRSLCKYEDKFYTSGIGTVSYFAVLYNATGGKTRSLERISDKELEQIVQRSADILLYRTRAAAPYRTGALRSGIIRSSSPERSSRPGKRVYDLVMDAEMNDTFVKYTNSGKRYYYPGSMEYGFRLKNGKRYPGKHYLRDSALAYAEAHVSFVTQEIDKILEDL